MKKKTETVYLDSEEKDILDSYDKGEWVSTLTPEKKRYYEDVAKYSMGKNKRINIDALVKSRSKSPMSSLRY